jgi:hypothetical protein
MSDEPKPQLDKFKEAARALECDDDEARFNERVKKLVRQKPAPEPEKPE